MKSFDKSKVFQKTQHSQKDTAQILVVFPSIVIKGFEEQQQKIGRLKANGKIYTESTS